MDKEMLLQQFERSATELLNALKNNPTEIDEAVKSRILIATNQLLEMPTGTAAGKEADSAEAAAE